MRKIVWNNKARLDFYENIDYLLENWSEKEAQNFIDEVIQVEYILSQGNVDFQDTNLFGVKRLVIRKQITLFYKIVNERQIEFLRFWNNYKDIRKLDL
jgi:plasmid stabilization system protein ParE